MRCALALMVVLAAASPAAAEWHRLDTPNFIVVGERNPRDLRSIAVEFEAFRETLTRVLSARATATPVPTVVIVFSDERAFSPFRQEYAGKPIRSIGYFHGDRDFNYIIVLDDGRPGGKRVIFHEYAHLVVSNLATNLPAWLNEGLAEYYSTYELSGGGREATIGRLIDGHVRVLSRRELLPLDQLLGVEQTSPLYNEGERRSVFYAQSWALTHMLMQRERAGGLAAFIRHKQQGLSDADAWRRTFGDADLHRELQMYLRRAVFKGTKYVFERGVGETEGTTATMSEPDVKSMLASLHVRQNRHDAATALIEQALHADPRHPHANVLMASIDSQRGKHADAAARLMRVENTADWLVAYTAGVTLTHVIDETRDPAADRLDRARSLLESVRRARGELPNVLAQLVMLDLMSGEGPSVATQAAIERARGLVPGRHDYALIHARVLAEMGELAVARTMLTALAAPGYPSHIRDTAKMWMTNIGRVEGAGTYGGRRMFYRARGPGEERLEGVLERIDCPVEAPAVFRVRTESGVQTLHAPSLGDVELITYRRDITRDMICGSWKDQAPVYLTWKTGAAPDVKVVVAVEFLPLNAR